MKHKLVIPILAAAIGVGNVNATTPYASDNPFVDAMVRMMEELGLLDRARPPVTVPYLPGAGLNPYTGYGMLGAYPGLGGMNPLTGFGGMPGAGSWPMNPAQAQGMVPGGMGTWSQAPQQWLGSSPVPQEQMQQWFGAGQLPQGQMQQWFNPATAPQNALDGAWELHKGGLVVINGNRARFYLTLDQHQDYTIGYDQSHLWWTPVDGTTPSRYRYRMQDDRMIIADEQDNYLLLRRR